MYCVLYVQRVLYDCSNSKSNGCILYVHVQYRIEDGLRRFSSICTTPVVVAVKLCSQRGGGDDENADAGALRPPLR